MLATRRIMASVDPNYEVDYDVKDLMEVARTPAGRAARTSASGQMLTLTELQTRLEFAALLETRRRMEQEPLDDKFMPGLADRFVAENPCPTSYRGARPKRTSTTIKTQFALAGEANLDPIDNDGLSIQSKLDAIEAQAPKALLATPQRSPTAVGVLAKPLDAGSDHLRLSEPLPRHETMEGWANASVVIGSGEGAELHRIRSVDARGTGALLPTSMPSASAAHLPTCLPPSPPSPLYRLLCGATLTLAANPTIPATRTVLTPLLHLPHPSTPPPTAVLRIGRPTERAHTAQPGASRLKPQSPRTPRSRRVAAAAAAEADRPQSARCCIASDGP